MIINTKSIYSIISYEDPNELEKVESDNEENECVNNI